jgi:galactokinase
MEKLPSLISQKYKELFHDQPLLIRSPGRVNLIGEHTDYNQGFVLPAAIDRAIYMAINLRDDDTINIIAFDKEESYTSDISSYQKSDLGWPNYILGVIDEFRKREIGLRGFNCVFGGDIPIGSGLSSSAALEGAVSVTMNHLLQSNFDKLDLVKIGQAAEHNFAGVLCGIMDQYINIFGETGSVLRID